MHQGLGLKVAPAFFGRDVILKRDASGDGFDRTQVDADDQARERHVLLRDLQKEFGKNSN